MQVFVTPTTGLTATNMLFELWGDVFLGGLWDAFAHAQKVLRAFWEAVWQLFGRILEGSNKNYENPHKPTTTYQNEVFM